MIVPVLPLCLLLAGCESHLQAPVAPLEDVAQKVPVHRGQSIQSVVDAQPAGTTFLIKAGVHRRQSVRPKDGMTFVGEDGAVLDGENAVEYAFRGDSPKVHDVTIRNLEIKGYNSPLQYGAIRGGGNLPADSPSGWVVEDCYIHHNAALGIRTGHRMVVRNNRLVYNGQMGMGGNGDNILVEGNEIAHNNTRGIYSGWEAGGTKFVFTRNLVVRGNHVHNNRGPGLWADIDNLDSVFENNRVEDNQGVGIVFEISFGAVIRNNHVEGNGWGDADGWVGGAGILVQSSQDVEVYGNTVKNNNNGIIGLSEPRGTSLHGEKEVRNLWVHDNTVVQSGNWAAGIAAHDGDKPMIYTNWGNRFDHNTYTVGSGTHFDWQIVHSTWDRWRAQGQDINGTLTR